MKLFKTITIRTPESVELEFTLAGVGNRALALLIDYVLVFLLLSLVSFLASFLSEQLVALFAALGGGADAVDLWLVALALVLSASIYWGYFVGFEAWWQGQTPGKRITKIRVINDTGKPEGVFQATLRSLLRPVDDILFIGFFCILFGQQEKRIGDWLAGTLVVQSEQAVGDAKVTVSTDAKTLALELIEQAMIGNLLPDDFAALREYLQRRKSLTKVARQQLSVDLARQLREIIELEKLPQEEMPAERFLEAVYTAYQQKFGDRRRSYR
ncbi:RDD family protein [Oscillatoria sp. CS-180]|uniref:RDD family protein n=1 Tax=Oscillatoria sp. CS-180 TaxID=3021720 RepID=UPI00233053B8|nr:RDD family protein [Oscillatoria sp. CS-180]MDB9527048.1 RDD family protein [Oscillatoria sp. CS-180]